MLIFPLVKTCIFKSWNHSRIWWKEKKKFFHFLEYFSISFCVQFCLLLNFDSRFILLENILDGKNIQWTCFFFWGIWNPKSHRLAFPATYPVWLKFCHSLALIKALMQQRVCCFPPANLTWSLICHPSFKKAFGFVPTVSEPERQVEDNRRNVIH